jgi:hypothetical protein
MFRSNDLGSAIKHFESLGEGDISKKYANRQAFYSPPTTLIGRELSHLTMDSKLSQLKSFYPHQKNINETHESYTQYAIVIQ